MWVFTYSMESLHQHNYKYKAKTQHVYKLHDNDFIYNSFGTNENCHRKKFKTFSVFPNPLIKHPPKTQLTNWKV